MRHQPQPFATPIDQEAGRAAPRPNAGCASARLFQGVEHVVTVREDGFEWQGRTYKSLSRVARAITGTQWNGWVFFGLRGAGHPR